MSRLRSKVKRPLIEPIDELTKEAVDWLQRKAKKAMAGKTFKPIPSALKKRKIKHARSMTKKGGS